ncbi:sensor domain-containing protein, partial [Streptomyces sp. SID3343]|uniref:sensor domain-containing protein n=1 Tax=Streptomyces sp. SID3343 TaxID=2690260 RepID=UPI0013C294DE
EIEQPYRAAPPAGGGIAGLWRRNVALVSDPATWRDLLHSLVNPVVGFLLAVLPMALIAFGLLGIVMPFVHEPIVDAGGTYWYAMIPVQGASTALAAVPLGIAFLTAGILTGPRVLRAHALWTRSLLGPVASAAPAPITAPASHEQSAARITCVVV